MAQQVSADPHDQPAEPRKHELLVDTVLPHSGIGPVLRPVVFDGDLDSSYAVSMRATNCLLVEHPDLGLRRRKASIDQRQPGDGSLSGFRTTVHQRKQAPQPRNAGACVRGDHRLHVAVLEAGGWPERRDVALRQSETRDGGRGRMPSGRPASHPSRRSCELGHAPTVHVWADGSVLRPVSHPQGRAAVVKLTKAHRLSTVVRCTIQRRSGGRRCVGPHR